MFEVDLLKGQGIPVRFRPETAVTIAIALIAPVLTALAFTGMYVHNSIVIAIQKDRLASYDDKHQRLAAATQIQKELSKDRSECYSCLLDIRESLERQVQWSETIRTIVSTLPSSVVMTDMEVQQRVVRRKVADKDNPKKKTMVSIPVRTLRMSVSGAANEGNDAAVRDFRKRLWASAELGPKLDNIEVSQHQQQINGKGVVSYEIECTFKTEI